MCVETMKGRKQRSGIDTKKVPHLTHDNVWESDKNTRKLHIQESQEVSPLTTGDHKTASNRNDIMAKTNTKNQKDTQKKHRLGTVSQKITGGLNIDLRFTI